MTVARSNIAVLPATGKWPVALPRPANHPRTHPVVECAERTIQACVNAVGTERNMQDEVPNTLRAELLTDVGYAPIPGVSKLLERVEERRWQVQCGLDSIARADRKVDSALQQTGECVGAANARMKSVTADLARTLCSTEDLPDGETQVLARVYKAVSDVLNETTHTVERMHRIKSQVDNARLSMLLIDEGAAGVAESPDVASPTGGLSGAVDELVKKSPTLWDLIADFRSRGGSIGYHDADGKGSEVVTNSSGRPVLLLAKDSSQSPEATASEIAWQLGQLGELPDDVAQQVKPGVSQVALAALVGAQVHFELVNAGEKKIGLPHPNGESYLDIYEKSSSKPQIAYTFLYQQALADYEAALRRDAWKATIVPNPFGVPQN